MGNDVMGYIMRCGLVYSQYDLLAHLIKMAPVLWNLSYGRRSCKTIHFGQRNVNFRCWLVELLQKCYLDACLTGNIGIPLH